MSLSTSIRFARRELRGGLRGFRIFLACLALGVAAIAAVGTVRSAIEAGLVTEGAALLGGDAELDFTYRFATPEERAWIDQFATSVSEIADFRSMAVVDAPDGTERGLTQIKAVDNMYPLVGSVRLTPDMPLAQALGDQNGLPGGVMERALIDRLDLHVGDTFRLGTQDFILAAELTREPDSSAGGFALGPRTIVLLSSLENANLLATGTRYDS
ncbi:ABC transporter permease, partial [Tateyamaria sp.]